MIVLDTDVISELMRHDPDGSVVCWVDQYRYVGVVKVVHRICDPAPDGLGTTGTQHIGQPD